MNNKISICECDTCKKIKNRIKNSECIYCHEHHDSRVHCIAEVDARMKKTMSLAEPDIWPARDTVHDEDEIDSMEKLYKETTFKKPENDYEYYIDIANGKYSVYQRKNGSLRALRYGETWRDLTGDNLVFNMMVELIETKKTIQEAINYLAGGSAYRAISILKGEK